MGNAATSDGAFLSSSSIVDAGAQERRNLIVEGRLDAQVPLHAHSVAIAKTGRVQGDIHAALIRIEGEVVGDLYGEVQIRVCHTASVRGNITAPNVIVEPGATFEGRIAIEPPPAYAPVALATAGR